MQSTFRRATVAIVCTVIGAAALLAWHSRASRVAKNNPDSQPGMLLMQAQQGDPEAEAALGAFYMRGSGVPRDFDAGLRWYRKAAEKGSAAGEAGLGDIYYYGAGVKSDFAEAFRWYSKAAEQGNPHGENAVGYLYQHGDGVALDYGQALSWYRKAADQHYAPAEYKIGYLYYYGEGVPADRALANHWFAIAAAGGYVNAERALSQRYSALLRVVLLIELLGGLFLIASVPLKLNYLAHSVAWDRNRKATVMAGAFVLLHIAVQWYGYTHFKLRKLGAPLNAYTCFHWAVEIGSLIALAYMVRVAQMEAARRSEAEPDDVSLS